MTVVTLPGTRHRAEDFELDPEVLAGLWRMEDHHFWHAARNRWILRALAAHGAAPGARVLDIGCGGGAVAAALARRGYEVTGVDTAEVLVRKADERCPGATFIAGQLADLPARYDGFDAVALLDVLEHLDDPAALLAGGIRRARPGALVVATVPALRSLHTIVDDLSGHKKRYEPGELAALLRAAGLVDVEERGIFRALRPLVRLSRRRAPARPLDGIATAERRRILLDDVRVPHPVVNRLLGLLCGAELRFGFTAARNKAGPTLLATARVPS
jgi:SAM-dependent methyltransferase